MNGGDFAFSINGSGDIDAARSAFKQFAASLKAPGSPVTVTSGQFTSSEGLDDLLAPSTDPAVN